MPLLLQPSLPLPHPNSPNSPPSLLLALLEIRFRKRNNTLDFLGGVDEIPGRQEIRRLRVHAGDFGVGR